MKARDGITLQCLIGDGGRAVGIGIVIDNKEVYNNSLNNSNHNSHDITNNRNNDENLWDSQVNESNGTDQPHSQKAPVDKALRTRQTPTENLGFALSACAPCLVRPALKEALQTSLMVS